MGIRIEELGKQYGDRWAVRALTFEVKPGEVVGLLGPNGAGKSTTMRMLTGLTKASEGSALVNGRSVLDTSPHRRRGVGYLPEQNPLYLDQYVLEYLLFSARLSGLKRPKAAAERVIAQTGLGSERQRKIGVLSKGYRQRVGLAAALIHDPDVLILDEPTSGLDPNQIVEIRNVIREVGRQKAVLLSSHIMQEVEATCDRVAIINRGKLVAEGKTDELMGEHQGTRVVIAFAQPVSKEQVAALLPELQVESLPNGEWLISKPRSENLSLELFRAAVREGLELITLHARHSHLEDTFRLLTADQTKAEEAR